MEMIASAGHAVVGDPFEKHPTVRVRFGCGQPWRSACAALRGPERTRCRYATDLRATQTRYCGQIFGSSTVHLGEVRAISVLCHLS
jgi:hypothetical protein